MELLPDTERLDIIRSLKTDHLDDIYRILEDSKDWRFKRWEIKKYIKVNEFVEFIRVK